MESYLSPLRMQREQAIRTRSTIEPAAARVAIDYHVLQGVAYSMEYFNVPLPQHHSQSQDRWRLVAPTLARGVGGCAGGCVWAIAHCRASRRRHPIGPKAIAVHRCPFACLVA